MLSSPHQIDHRYVMMMIYMCNPYDFICVDKESLYTEGKKVVNLTKYVQLVIIPFVGIFKYLI